MGTILQWNCRGLMNNHQELCLLSQQYSPVVKQQIQLNYVSARDTYRRYFQSFI